ncbi:palindromic element RPE4 domain-containing protein [Candidatus Rickettsia colombianensi]|uniref:palindromic element RPE4 domain-containing protein n=1 Tax=Candidatus Rickettsia colombianensi TaxID=1090944 RepID=UPI000EF18370|nr:palindromic element RPE4 domain-containing protein [Candidatus Rickettsia colombianensi]
MQGYRYHFVIVSDIVAGFEFLNVIPRLDRGIQSFFFIFFLDTVVKPRYDTERNTHSQ